MRCLCDLGLSAQAIAGRGNHHPWDPSDLLRCVNYWTGTTDELRERMAGRSPQWDRLLPHWDELVALLRHEMDTRADGTAPRTYRAMKRVLDDGITCADCDGTGDGALCGKCKGSGRRSRGTCRAPNCRSGAHPCPFCRGRGYHLRTAA